jgi:hypothetical protein
MGVVIDIKQQVIQSHAKFIVLVVMCCQNKEYESHLEAALQQAELRGWHKIVVAVRQIVSGQASRIELAALDDEDRMILEAILEGLKNPQSLPDPLAKKSPDLAAPGIAALINQAASGDVQALHMASMMAKQMSGIDRSFALLAAAIKPMIDGERDLNKLCHGMDDKGCKLMEAIVEKLPDRDDL